MTSIENLEIKLPESRKGRKSKEQKIKYLLDLKKLSKILIQLQEQIAPSSFIRKKDKVSSRGWAYLLEGYGAITKDQMDYAQKIINKARKKGFLPMDFVAEDKSRSFFHVEALTEDYKDPKEYLLEKLDYIKDVEQYKEDIAFWESQEYYIQLLVEKIDVLNLFDDISEKYHIASANAKGWSSLLERYKLVMRFKKAEKIGLKPVLLYYSDFDPTGLKIAENLRKNFKDIQRSTEWSPDNLIIDRFGLTIDFINKNDLLWIDNLTTGSGRDLGKLYNKYKEGKKTNLIDYEIEYIETYGVKKCEANAILPIRTIAVRDYEETIQKYLGNNPFEKYNESIRERQEEVIEIMDSVNFKEKIEQLIEEIKSKNQEKNN